MGAADGGEQFLPAFEHLPDNGRACALTVDLWGESGSALLCAREWQWLAQKRFVQHAASGVRAFAASESLLLSLYDPGRRLVTVLAPEPERVKPWERAAPLRAVLGWWFADSGGLLVHGAAVGKPSGAVLLTEKSGSGKSTAALACLTAGWAFQGDDYVGLFPGRECKTVSLYCRAKVQREFLDQTLPGLSDTVSEVDEFGKAVVDLFAGYRSRLAGVLPLRAVVVHQRSEGPPKFRRAASADVLRALVPSTVLQLPGCSPDIVRRLGHTAASLPGYVFEASPDLNANVVGLESLLAEVMRV
jgi:hypothetical protein